MLNDMLTFQSECDRLLGEILEIQAELDSLMQKYRRGLKRYEEGNATETTHLECMFLRNVHSGKNSHVSYAKRKQKRMFL